MGMPIYSGTFSIKKDNLDLMYNFEIVDNSFRFFNVGKVFGTGEKDKKGLEKIAELNKTIATKLNLELREKKIKLEGFKLEQLK